MANHVLLCLNCRQSGHDVEHCTVSEWAGELDWFFSTARMQVYYGAIERGVDGTICSRCESLHLIQFLDTYPPWEKQADFADQLARDDDFTKCLGTTGSVQFWADCSVCCCIFVITPQPSSVDQEIFLTLDWTISRLSGELGAVTMDSPEKRGYATCILFVLQPSSLHGMPTRIVAHRGDSLCLLDTNLAEQRTLGARWIDSHDINVDMILQWIKMCEQRHDEFCLPVPTKALNAIRLIDVDSRKIVAYPGTECEYTALSYVWGDVAQHNYRLGDTVGELPATLEDALLFTKKLGKKYAWIDSVCIDQSDEEDKINQINRMGSIYQGAWITIIALSGVSAEAGFPRLSRKEYHPQVACQVKGRTLVTLMPTLSQQIWKSPWGRRAWTLQEGLLSPRCLYVSDHQIYFDCASMQCCESLDDSRSWAHGLTPALNPTEEGFVTWMLRQAGAGALRIPLDWPARRLEHWGEKLNLYSYRSMTYSEDAISAFSGVLQRLKTIYPLGFFWGLPVEDFNWALTWASQMPPQRREGFPSWSWAGWKGALFFGQPLHVENTRRMITSLSIRVSTGLRLEESFPCNGDYSASKDKPSLLISNDPIDKAAQLEPLEAEFQLEMYPAAEKSGYLFVTAVCFQFIPDFSNPRTATYASGQNETFSFLVRGVRCYIRIFSTDRYIPGHWTGENWVINQTGRTEDTFILLARDHMQGHIIHKLLLVAMKDSESVAERVTVLEVLVPLDDIQVLEEFKPRRRRIVLK